MKTQGLTGNRVEVRAHKNGYCVHVAGGWYHMPLSLEEAIERAHLEAQNVHADQIYLYLIGDRPPEMISVPPSPGRTLDTAPAA